MENGNDRRISYLLGLVMPLTQAKIACQQSGYVAVRLCTFDFGMFT